MKEILSAENKKVVKAASLGNKKYRDLYSLYLIEGKRAVFDAVKCGAPIELVFVSKEYAEKLPFDESGFEIYSVPAEILKKICQTVEPQSVAATVKIIRRDLPQTLPRALVLDGIRDPANAGAVIRSAAACGIEHIFMRDCCDPYNPKSVRATMGGINFVTPYVCGGEIIGYLKQKGLYIICADMDGKDLFSFELPSKNFALVIGGEAEGIKEDYLKACDAVVKIPMQNIESLNAAVSAAVIMYNLTYRK